MSIIPTRIHGIIDYLTAVLLIAAPWLFNFWDAGTDETHVAGWVAIAAGAVLLILSLATDYELGAAHLVDMKLHLWLDVGLGIFLIASPWLFGFSEWVWIPHVVVGVAEILIAMITSPEPPYYSDRVQDAKR